MTFLQALRKARRLIKSRHENFICCALEIVGGLKYVSRISQQLNGCSTYEIWMMRFHCNAYMKMCDDDFRKGRLQWIDYMIAQELKK